MIPSEVKEIENRHKSSKLDPEIIAQFSYIPLTVLECFDWSTPDIEENGKHQQAQSEVESEEFDEREIDIDIDMEEPVDDEGPQPTNATIFCLILTNHQIIHINNSCSNFDLRKNIDGEFLFFRLIQFGFSHVGSIFLLVSILLLLHKILDRRAVFPAYFT